MSFSHKKWNLAICDNMYGPWGHYTKWSKSENDKYGIKKGKPKKQIQIYREQIDDCQRWGVVREISEGGQKVEEKKANTVDI